MHAAWGWWGGGSGYNEPDSHINVIPAGLLAEADVPSYAVTFRTTYVHPHPQICLVGI